MVAKASGPGLARNHLIEEIEETWEEPFVVESDKAWDAIHRCLTDGSLLYAGGVCSR
jgi:hypothetical protein